MSMPTLQLGESGSKESLLARNGSLDMPVTPPPRPSFQSPTPKSVAPTLLSPSTFGDAVFKIQHTPGWEETMKAVIDNFDWKNHFVIGQYGEIYEFADENGTLNGSPVPSSFPLTIMFGKRPPAAETNSGSEVSVIRPNEKELPSWPERLPESHELDKFRGLPGVPSKATPPNEVEGKGTPKTVEGVEPSPSGASSPTEKVHEFKGPQKEEHPEVPSRKSTKSNMYDDGSYWKILVCDFDWKSSCFC